MYDFDVIIIGGGINGLTAAAYLGKAGAKVLVLEARGECGAHCTTDEITQQGFLHNLHATWIITPLSPAMEDLELEKYGLEFTTTKYVYGKTFKDGKCALFGLSPDDTIRNWEKISKEDVKFILNAIPIILENWQRILDQVHNFLFTAPDEKKIEDGMFLVEEIAKKMGIKISPKELLKMNGFQVLDIFFESEYIKTLIASLSWIGGFPPIHRKIGSAGCATLAPMIGVIYPVCQLKGGSHALTHALTRCCYDNKVKILTNSPVEKIICDKNKVVGVKLSEDAIFPGEEIRAKVVISNLTFSETFRLIDEDKLPFPKIKIELFSYDEQVLFGVHYALKSPPEFSSAKFDEGIQKCFMGYFGGENIESMKKFAVDLISGEIGEIMANWFVPTLADPSQAPDGCHTAFIWFDVPPLPVKWKGRKILDGFEIWDKIKFELANDITEAFENYAPGFKKKILDYFVYTPLDTWRNNRSAILGNWIGGAVIPEQFYVNRPMPGVIVKGKASKTLLQNLFLSNSIHPTGATWLASGYLAAKEVAEELELQNVFKAKAVSWYIKNLNKISILPKE